MTYQARVYVDGRLQIIKRPNVPISPPVIKAQKLVAQKPAQVRELTQKPFPLFDYLINERGFKNDSAIARLLDTTASYVGRLRNGHVPIGPKIILAVYDATGMSIEEIRALLRENQ